MNGSCYAETIDNGPNPYTANVERMGQRNTNFRTTLWTGTCLQMTLMSILPYAEIGLEIHEDTDQYIRVEQGNAVVKMGKCKNHLDFQRNLCKDEAVFVPAGTWHNIVNVGRSPLKLSSVYAPPHHRKGTVRRTKADAKGEEY